MLADRIIDAVQNTIGVTAATLHEPNFIGNEWLYVKNCLDQRMVSSIGSYVNQFENKISDFTGAKYVVATMNGTSALHLALRILGVGCGDEVLMPALTFIATANAVSYCGATPHFLDSEEQTFGIDPGRAREYLHKNTKNISGECINIRTGKQIKVIICMHVFGIPSGIGELIELANEFNLLLLEDSAESLGSYYDGRHTGTFGKAGILSFNGNKVITTGGGGAILTNCENTAKLARHLSTTARVPHQWEFTHDEVGFNYRMPNLNAALGLAQLEYLNATLKYKRKLHGEYKKNILGIDEIRLVSEPNNCISNYWLNTILLNEENECHRDIILEKANSTGLMLRPIWKLMTELAPYKSCPQMQLETASSLVKRAINLPSSSFLGQGLHETI